MRYFLQLSILIFTFIFLCGFSVRTQTADLQMIDIVPLNEPALNENLRYRAVCTNNGPDSLPDSTEVHIIWTVKNQPINARYELPWPVNDTFRLLSPPYLFTSPDSFEVCAELNYLADSNTTNNKICITQVLEAANFVQPQFTGKKFEIKNKGGVYYVFGQNPTQARWKMLNTAGEILQTGKGERFVPKAPASGIYIIEVINSEFRLVEKVYLHGNTRF